MTQSILSQPRPMPALICNATPGDAPDLAWFINAAGDGLPLAHWRNLAAPGQDPWAVGAARMAVDQGENSWRNWRLAIRGDQVAGGLCHYLMPSEPTAPGPDLNPAFVPMVELENLALGSWHIHVLAVRPTQRGHGLGRALLDQAGQEADGRLQSLIVDSRNRAAYHLYRACGFVQARSRRIVAGDGRPQDGHWLLMVR